MKNYFIIIILILLFCFVSLKSFAANTSDIFINEIAWMGTIASTNDEWLELYNNTNSAITLDGWVLKANDNTPNIKLTGVISANGFYLLERTDDTTVPNIAADQIYTGAIGNNGEDLKLYDNLNNLIDGVNFSSGWIAGDNATKQTMEKNLSGWQTSKDIGGTPKFQNSIGAVVKSEPTPAEETLIKTLTLTYPTGVILNEILPSPEGPDEENEWIELYNQNNFEVDLQGWKIQDIEGAATTYIFPENTKITGQGYLVLKRPETKITLNNDKDGLNFLTPDKKNIDSLTYNNAPRNQSYNKIGSGWEWSDSLTPGSLNTAFQSRQKNNENLSNLKKSDISKEIEAGIAISQNASPAKSSKMASPSLDRGASPWSLFLTALIITAISGIIILILKIRFKTPNT